MLLIALEGTECNRSKNDFSKTKDIEMYLGRVLLSKEACSNVSRKLPGLNKENCHFITSVAMKHAANALRGAIQARPSSNEK